MINPFQGITTHSGFDFQDYLTACNLFRIFEKVFEMYGNDPENCKKIILYIVYAHSIESPRITVAGDRRKELESIFEWLDIPDQYHDEVVSLQSWPIVDAVFKWMKYKDNRQIEYVLTLQNAYSQQQEGALNALLSHDQRMGCVNNMTKIKTMIKDGESELQQNDAKLKAGYEEVNKAKSKKSTLSAAGAASL